MHPGIPVVVLAAVLAASTASANSFTQTLEQQLRELDAALFAPKQIERFEPIDASWSCDALSLEVTRLVPASRSTRPSFYSDPVNAAILAAGTVFTSAFYMLGIPEYARYREQRHIDNAGERIAALRAAMADRRCYVR